MKVFSSFFLIKISGCGLFLHTCDILYMLGAVLTSTYLAWDGYYIKGSILML